MTGDGELMVDKSSSKEPENEAICCCASGPIFLVGRSGAEKMPIPAWGEEWATWKAQLTRLTHTFGFYFVRHKGFMPIGRNITETNVASKAKRLFSEIFGGT